MFHEKGFSQRGTVIVDKNGIIRWKKVNPLDVDRDNDEILKELEKL